MSYGIKERKRYLHRRPSAAGVQPERSEQEPKVYGYQRKQREDNQQTEDWTGKTYGEPDTIAEGSRLKAPYETLWHEYGHNLDWLAGDNGKPKHPYYTASNLVGKTPQHLNEMVVGEVDRSLRDYWSKVHLDESPFDPKTALVNFGMDIQGPYRDAIKSVSGLSDMMGLYCYEHGGSVRPMFSGHDADYWNANLTGKNTESFADLTAAAALGGDSLRYIQAVLPNTYEAYLDMLGDMATNDPYSRQNTHPQYKSTRKKRRPF